MTWLVVALALAAPPIFIAFRVRAGRCRLCKAATASPLVGLLLLWAATPWVNGVGMPGPVQFVLGMVVAAVVLEPLPRALSRWLHAGPPHCGSPPPCPATRALDGEE